MENTVLEKFHQGRQSLGTFSAIGSPLAVESLRYTGLDYVIVDTEHSPAGIESAAAQIAAAQGAGLTALARANEISRTAVLRLLDVGAQGVVVPPRRRRRAAPESCGGSAGPTTPSRTRDSLPRSTGWRPSPPRSSGRWRRTRRSETGSIPS